MLLNDFNYEFGLKIETTPKKSLSCPFIFIFEGCRIYLRNGPFVCDIGILNLHPFEGTLWVIYINENFFDSYACAPPQTLFKFILKRNGYCLLSEYNWRILWILRLQKDFKLHVEEVGKKGDKVKTKSNEFSISDFDISKKETLEELKGANYHDLEE